MEKTITIQDMKRAISYVRKGRENAENWDTISDEDFLKLDFVKDLHMGNIRLVNVIFELQKNHNITLPVEIDASKRAVNWLEESGIVARDQRDMAVSALRSAAYTYVVAALSALATLLYYIMIFLGRSKN